MNFILIFHSNQGVASIAGQCLGSFDAENLSGIGPLSSSRSKIFIYTIEFSIPIYIFLELLLSVLLPNSEEILIKNVI